MIGGIAPRLRAAAQPSVCAEFRERLFPSASSSYIQIRTSTKRGGGSTKNNRTSIGKRLGVKKFGTEYVLPGQIIVRQRGLKFHPGQFVGVGRDHTLYALEPGYLRFYHSHLPFPHVERSTLITPDCRNVSKPGTIDDGTKDYQAPLPPKVFPPVKHPRGQRRYIGVVRNKEDILPRDQKAEGRERMFFAKVVEQDPAADP